MATEEEQAAFKSFVIERSRDPAEAVDAKGRALMACLVIPAPIQRWMVDAGIVEPLIDSIAKTITAAEETERERCAKIAEAIDSGRGNEKVIAASIRHDPKNSPPF